MLVLNLFGLTNILLGLIVLSKAPAVEAAPDISVMGRVTLDTFRGDGSFSSERLELNFVPRLEVVSDDGSMVAEVEVRVDRDNPSHRRLRPRRLYVQTRLGPVDLRVGNQVVAWGQMDARRPVDRLNPHDYSDFIDDVVLETPMVRLRTGMSWLEFDAAIAPFFTASELPESEDCSWSLLRGLPTLGSSESGDVRIGRLDRTGVTVGSRLTFRVLRTDLSATYITGRDNLPVSFGVVTADGRLYLDPVSPKTHVFGLDVVRALGRVALRGEAAYVRTADVDGTNLRVDDPYIQAGTSIELLLNGLASGHDVSVLAEFHVDREVVGRGAENAVDLPSLRHFYQYATFARAAYRAGVAWEFALQAYAGIDSGDLLLRPAVTWRPGEGSLLLSLRADFVGSGSESFLRSYADNDRIGLLTSYEF